MYIKDRPETLVQADKAPAHVSRYQQEVFDFYIIKHSLWPGNSPDLNAIEPTWFWMKRVTTKHGALTSNKKLKVAWIKCWEDMPQEAIQAWIERIPEHIKEVTNQIYIRKGVKRGKRKEGYTR